jgi:hypothetical protein
MAKVQKATLDPSKISGHCGRLKCCLRYEDSTYKELKKNLPNKNSWVKTDSGEGKVIDSQIMTQLVSVIFTGGKIEAFPVESIEVLADRPPERKPEDSKPQRPLRNQRPERRKPQPQQQQANAPQPDGEEKQTPQAADGDAPPTAKKKRRRRRRRKSNKPAGENTDSKE